MKLKVASKIHAGEEPPGPVQRPEDMPPPSNPPSKPAEPAGERADRTAHGRRSKVTPKTFRALLPKEGNVEGMSGKHDHTKQFFSIVYPCHFTAVDPLCYFAFFFLHRLTNVIKLQQYN